MLLLKLDCLVITVAPRHVQLVTKNHMINNKVVVLYSVCYDFNSYYHLIL